MSPTTLERSFTSQRAEQLTLPLPEIRFASRQLRRLQLVRSMSDASLSIAESWRSTVQAGAQRLAPSSRKQYERHWERFERFARAHQVEVIHEVDRDLIEKFVNAGQKQNEQFVRPRDDVRANRLSSLRFLFTELRTAGLVAFDPTQGILVRRTVGLRCRPLNDDQIHQCREAAQGAMTARDRYTCAFASMEAGTSTGELGELAWPDVSASGEYIVVAPDLQAGRPERVLRTTRWGARHLRSSRPADAGDSSVAAGTATGYDSRRTTVTHVIREILNRAGLSEYEPRSITAWVARRAYQHGGIEGAARTIGFASLDRTAELIGLDWRGNES
jgi:site-specific recombinase XerD